MPIIVPNCNEIIVKLNDLYKYNYNTKLKDLLYSIDI